MAMSIVYYSSTRILGSLFLLSLIFIPVRADELANIVRSFSTHDVNRDGILEIESLTIPHSSSDEEAIAHSDKLLLVIVESRLIENDRRMNGERSSFTQTLQKYKQMLQNDGWRAAIIEAKVQSDHTQMAECLMYYGNGLGRIGRAKVYFDIPTGFGEVFTPSKGTFGDVLNEYFRIESENAKLSRSVASRNRAYFWSILGDWTLRMQY